MSFYMYCTLNLGFNIPGCLFIHIVMNTKINVYQYLHCKSISTRYQPHLQPHLCSDMCLSNSLTGHSLQRPVYKLDGQVSKWKSMSTFYTVLSRGEWATQDGSCLTPVVLNIILGNVKVCTHFRSFLNTEMVQAPVPLSIFRSNSKFDENSERSSFKYTGPITTIFCSRHDSDTVVTCAKYRCDRPCIFYTRVLWIFIEFRIRSKYA